MNSDIEIYRPSGKPKPLRSYKYIFLILLFLLITVWNVLTSNNCSHDFSNIIKSFGYFLTFLIFFIATRGTLDAITEIAIDNSENTIEIKYIKGPFHNRERSKYCDLKYIKYSYNNKLFEQNQRIKKKIYLEMFNGDFFEIKESKGFSSETLEQLAKSLESHNCRKFDS